MQRARSGDAGGLRRDIAAAVHMYVEVFRKPGTTLFSRLIH